MIEFPQIIHSNIQVFKNAQLEEEGINVDGEKLLGLRFANDVALTTEGVEDIEHQLNTVNEESLQTGLRYIRKNQIYDKYSQQQKCK